VITLSDVARRAGVSLATASRALNGSPGRSVRPELRERVAAAADELGYLPHAAAQTMARGHSSSVGLLVNDISDPYFASVAAGVTSAASRYGCIVTLSSTGLMASAKAPVVDLMAGQRVRALILAGGVWAGDPALPDLAESLRRLAATGARISTVGAEVPGVSNLLLPNHSGAAALATALFDLGHRTFSVISGPDEQPTSVQRTESFISTIGELGGRVLTRVRGDYTRESGYAVMGDLLDAWPLPDVFFAVNDLMALGAMRRLREAGLRVPRDVGLAGFGDIDSVRDAVPPLTSVAMDAVQAGELATELVLGDDDQPRTIELGFTLSLRESTERVRRG